MNLSLGKEKRKKLEEKNMTKEEIFEELKELVTDQLGVEDDEVTLEASIQDGRPGNGGRRKVWCKD